MVPVVTLIRVSVLITGPAGVGKTTIAKRLRAFDADVHVGVWYDRHGQRAHWPIVDMHTHEFRWDEAQLDTLLAWDPVLCGIACNTFALAHKFDHRIYLTAPDKIIAKRLRQRAQGYGKTADEFACAMQGKKTLDATVPAGFVVIENVRLQTTLARITQQLRSN